MCLEGLGECIFSEIELTFLYKGRTEEEEELYGNLQLNPIKVFCAPMFPFLEVKEVLINYAGPSTGGETKIPYNNLSLRRKAYVMKLCVGSARISVGLAWFF